MDQILVLTREEPVRLDADRLRELYTRLGDVGAEDVVCRAMEEIAVRLAHTERLYRQDRMAEMRKSARSLVAIADQVGMRALSVVAEDVTRCIDAGDPVALAATLSRLLRVGERSLIAIWDLQDVTL
ncbi:hypothetical protein [Oceanicola sp. S124]|uniref:hypothetical protein n=1 Tax=Oceanicola sp. S124 TaxID=1042378 RepID=UPI0002557A5C|nr:hypothetical protein [Oceanicola sp. S124]